MISPSTTTVVCSVTEQRARFVERLPTYLAETRSEGQFNRDPSSKQEMTHACMHVKIVAPKPEGTALAAGSAWSEITWPWVDRSLDVPLTSSVSVRTGDCGSMAPRPERCG